MQEENPIVRQGAVVIDKTIPMLDHGFVRLVDHMGDDLSIVRAARCSYAAEWRAGEDTGSDKRLINYLMRNRHTTPFEVVTLTFDVKAPIFVLRQWHRHRMATINELSARYKELPEEFYIPEPHLIGRQNADNKQMRDVLTPEEFDLLPPDVQEANYEIVSAMMAQNETAFNLYRKLIADGVPRELARTVLPLGTYSHMFWSVDLHNLFHFIRLRAHSHAQYEISVYAKAMLELIEPVVPCAVAAFRESLDFEI